MAGPNDDTKSVKETCGLSEFMKIIKLSRNGVLKAVDEGRIRSAYKDDEGMWVFNIDRALQEYHELTTKTMSSIGRDEGDGLQYTDEQIAARRSVLDIPPEKWTTNEANQASAIYEALESKLSYEAKQGKYYPKASTDEKFHKITKLFADGLKRLPDELRQRHPDLSKPELKTLEKLLSDIRKEISAAL